MRRLGLLVVVALALSACGGSSTADQGYDPAASSAALTEAGWTAASGQGMSPLAGGKQLGWLDATSPAGVKVSLQFLESSKKATEELAAIHNGAGDVKADPGFDGATIGNVLVFVRPNGHQRLPGGVVESLGGLLVTTKQAGSRY